MVPLWDMDGFRAGIVYFPRIVVPRIGACGVAMVVSNTALDLDRGSTQATLVDVVVEGASMCWKPYLDVLVRVPVRVSTLCACSRMLISAHFRLFPVRFVQSATAADIYCQWEVCRLGRWER